MITDRQAGPRGISDKSVQQKTGKTWAEWFSLLDQWPVKERGHTRTAKYLREEHGLEPWWAQAVSIRDEWERGLRE